jgi:hypothetical protein
MTETERRTFLRNSGLAITAAAIGESLSSPARAQTTEGAAPKETVPDDATRRLARFIIASGFDDLPETVRHEAKRTLVNWIGCAIGGSPQDAVTDAIVALSPFMGAPQASLLGRSERTDVLHASLLNGSWSDMKLLALRDAALSPLIVIVSPAPRPMTVLPLPSSAISPWISLKLAMPKPIRSILSDAELKL